MTLDDKYTVRDGHVYLSALQAAVRLSLMQRWRDSAAGLNTGGFISGYRGSPIGGYDNALWRAQKFLSQESIHFQPGVNEELAATSLWGSQQVNLFPKAKVDGVFGIWYGKGPGVDRSTDALKHGNTAGSAKFGGVLLLAGDDHGCQSSTLPHQSELTFQSAMIPVLNPATVQEILDFGLAGIALSRFSGCWIGFKTTSELMASSATVDVAPDRPKISVPDLDLPAGGLNIRWPDAALDQETRLHGPKMDAVAAFVRANAIDRLVLNPPRARLGIITTGKAYLDARQALTELGITNEVARALGIRLYKVGLSWPLEADGVRRFAEGLTEILVIEEKRAFIEDQLIRILYGMAADARPRVVGKRDEKGRPLLPSNGEITPILVAETLVARLAGIEEGSREFDADLRSRLALLRAHEESGAKHAAGLERTAFFCSGCPHNTSTRVPSGSRGLAGIGCHGMVMKMPDRNTTTDTQMGGEGANWIGQSPFTGEPHVFQNLGDGTYQHSGLLAIRAAAAAGVNITYKILYNDAVAMTGGQAVEGQPGVAEITHQVAAEGAKTIVVVTDEPEKYRATLNNLAPSAQIRHRDRLDAVQRELRATPGLTILIYDQTCAAEKRRRRKRGEMPESTRHVVINEAICEGCGDCAEQSNCIAVKPRDTGYGRKRQIDQWSCNQDHSCVKGFCPSFVTIRGGRLKRSGTKTAPPTNDLSTPAHAPLESPYGILITGIGGTGVVTVGALLGVAAHIEGKASTVLDSTGLAQKNGAVTSHVRMASSASDLHAARIVPGGADLILACDLVVAAGSDALTRIKPGTTRAVINSQVEPTAAAVTDGDIDFPADELASALRAACGSNNTHVVDAHRVATTLIGDAVATNVFMLGFAYQIGLIPLKLESLARAIELNGIAVDANRKSFAWGRVAAHDLSRVERILQAKLPPEAPRTQNLDALVAERTDFLVRYQNRAYGERYRRFVENIRAAETARVPGAADFTEAAAKSFFRLLAHKDEYEVARLHSDKSFQKKIRLAFEGDIKLEYHLAPPLLSRVDPATGQPMKRAYGPWMQWVFALLVRLKWLRATPFDPFGFTAERREAHRLVHDYERLIHRLLDELTPKNHALAVEIASLPQGIRGFGHVWARNLAAAKAREARLLAKYERPDLKLN